MELYHIQTTAGDARNTDIEKHRGIADLMSYRDLKCANAIGRNSELATPTVPLISAL